MLHEFIRARQWALLARGGTIAARRDALRALEQAHVPHVVEQEDPHGLWSPVTAAVVTTIPAIAAVLTGQVLLFPSLGPSAVMQAHSPSHRSSRFYNVVVSHVVGLLSAYLCVYLAGVAHAPSVFQVHMVSGGRAAAAVGSILLGTSIELALRASHPPAASTTLLAALGSFKPTLHEASLVIIGVLLVACAGEIARRVRLRARARTIPGP